ncbi:hypothetical protein [Salinivirga cyanobacteriivorans]
MKKSKRLGFLFLSALISVALSFTSCSDDDDDSNDNNGSGSGSATIGTTEISFSQGILEYYGPYQTGSDMYQYTIALASSGLTYQSESGTGDLMLFDVYTRSSSFGGGTFNFTNYSPEAGTSNYVSLMLNLQASTFTADQIFRATEGLIEITQDGASYDISFNLTMQEYDQETYMPIGDAQTLTGNYSGSMAYYDYTGKSKKHRINLTAPAK